MTKKKFSTYIMIFFSTLILTTATLISYFHEPVVGTIIPAPGITIPIMNTLCALISFSMFFCPNIYPLEIFLGFTQSVCTTLTGYETLGTFLFCATIILLFCNGFFKTNHKRKIYTLMIFWIIIIQGVLPFGIDRYFLEIAVSLFFAGFYYYIYLKLADSLSTFVPAKIVANTKVTLPPPGSEISLEDFNLNERQILLIKSYMKHSYSYAQMAQKYNISTSSVKKAMSEAFNVFGVKNIKELHILLLQYKI